jgi:hypothetical protein
MIQSSKEVQAARPIPLSYNLIMKTTSKSS